MGRAIELSDKIVADGKGNPWCVSAGGPGDATGWQITDWVEEVILKTKGLDFYNQWINHTVTFEDPGIKDVFDKYVGKIFFTAKLRIRRQQAIVNTDQKTAMDPMFNRQWRHELAQVLDAEDPVLVRPGLLPGSACQRGTPSAYTIGADGDVAIMPFPTIDPAQKNAEVSGDTFMVRSRPRAPRRDEVRRRPSSCHCLRASRTGFVIQVRSRPTTRPPTPGTQVTTS